MHILEQAYTFLQTKLLPHIAPKHTGLFTFGFEALTLRPYVSLNGNARMTVANRHTAESKIYRLVSKEAMLMYFTKFIRTLHLVKPTDSINVDFSDFCGFGVLTFAKQTHLGRSLPLFTAIIQYPIQDPGSQTLFIMEAIQSFINLLGFTPHLVFDRGFESPYIVPFLLTQKIPFILRLKKDKHVLYREKDIPLRNIPWYENDITIRIYGETLRVVVSEKLSEKKDGDGKEESWYLLTNDYRTPKELIIATYYFRFEIEETFKDLKHITRLKKPYCITKMQTLQILLWFSILGVWLSFLLEETNVYLMTRVTRKRRKKLSLMKFFAENIQLELFASFRKTVF